MILEEKKHLYMDLSADTHKEIKRRSLERNITMRAWILTAIIERIKVEEGFENESLTSQTNH